MEIFLDHIQIKINSNHTSIPYLKVHIGHKRFGQKNKQKIEDFEPNRNHIINIKRSIDFMKPIYIYTKFKKPESWLPSIFRGSTVRQKTFAINLMSHVKNNYCFDEEIVVDLSKSWENCSITVKLNYKLQKTENKILRTLNIKNLVNKIAKIASTNKYFIKKLELNVIHATFEFSDEPVKSMELIKKIAGGKLLVKNVTYKKN